MSEFKKLLALMIPLLPLSSYIPVIQSYNTKSKYIFSFVVIIVSFILISLFILGGEKVMEILEISPESLKLAGGLILLITGINLIFEKPDSDIEHIKSIKKVKDEGEGKNANQESSDITLNPKTKKEVSISEMLSWAIVPINLPLIIGPGVILWAFNISKHSSYVKVIPAILGNLSLQFSTLILGNLISELKDSNMYASIIKKTLGFLLAAIGSKYFINSTFSYMMEPNYNQLTKILKLIQNKV